MLQQFQTNDINFSNYITINDNLLFLDNINNKFTFKEISVTPDIAYRHQGNLYGLFSTMRIRTDLFLFTMYVNGYTNPVDYDGKKLTFKVPNKPSIPTN